MNTKKLISLIIVLFNLVLISDQANAVTFELRTAVKTLTLPDGTKVPMWGFGLKGSPITIPGPLLEVPPGDNTLTRSYALTKIKKSELIGKTKCINRL